MIEQERLDLFRRLSEMYGDTMEQARAYATYDTRLASRYNRQALTLETLAAGLAGILEPTDLENTVIRALFDRDSLTSSLRDISRALGETDYMKLHLILRRNGHRVQPSHIKQTLSRNENTTKFQRLPRAI